MSKVIAEPTKDRLLLSLPASELFEYVFFERPEAALQESFSSLPAGAAAIAYEESLLAADVVMQKLGAHTAILLQYLGRGQSFDDSLWLLGVQPADFQAAFNRRVR